ncbi:MAG: outer membrane beta-barrel protein, partial [Bacteroidia bacterium]
INKIDPGLDISGFNYRVNLTASYQITPTFIAEVFGNFNSPRINAQGKQPSFTTYNIAIRKQFFNKKASIAFTATNPFNKYISQKTETTGTNFTLNSLRQLPYRSFGINITYKFGKLEFKKEKAPEDVNLTNPGQGN